MKAKIFAAVMFSLINVAWATHDDLFVFGIADVEIECMGSYQHEDRTVDVFYVGHEPIKNRFHYVLVATSGQGVYAAFSPLSREIAGPEWVFEHNPFRSRVTMTQVSTMSIDRCEHNVPSGTIRMTMNFDRFVKPVSAVALGPAITAAMLYFPPGDF